MGFSKEHIVFWCCRHILTCNSRKSWLLRRNKTNINNMQRKEPPFFSACLWGAFRDSNSQSLLISGYLSSVGYSTEKRTWILLDTIVIYSCLSKEVDKVEFTSVSCYDPLPFSSAHWCLFAGNFCHPIPLIIYSFIFEQGWKPRVSSKPHGW